MENHAGVGSMEVDGKPQVVLAHDWLTGMRGGEKCLEVLCRRWPRAPLYTLLHARGAVSDVIEGQSIHTSILQHLPGVTSYYRYLLPLLPAVVERWRLPPCNLVVSMSHCVAKGIRPPAGVPHVCYCFTPMRYAWHQRHAYFGAERLGQWKAQAVDRVLQYLRDWDRRSAARVTHFIAISRTVQQRIAECYGRSSTVIYPPVDTEFFCPAPIRREDYYLVVSAFAPYKRLDLAIEACRRLKRPLTVIGTGQDAQRLRALAGGEVRFLGWQPDSIVRDHLRRCRALLFPGEEDFGIVPVEAQACGTPVIAYGKGGATETIVPPGQRQEPTGLWFEQQTADCLAEALTQLEARAREFSPSACRRQSQQFNRRRFEEHLLHTLDSVMKLPQMPSRRAA